MANVLENCHTPSSRVDYRVQMCYTDDMDKRLLALGLVAAVGVGMVALRRPDIDDDELRWKAGLELYKPPPSSVLKKLQAEGKKQKYRANTKWRHQGAYSLETKSSKDQARIDVFENLEGGKRRHIGLWKGPPALAEDEGDRIFQVIADLKARNKPRKEPGTVSQPPSGYRLPDPSLAKTPSAEKTYEAMMRDLKFRPMETREAMGAKLIGEAHAREPLRPTTFAAPTPLPGAKEMQVELEKAINSLLDPTLTKDEAPVIRQELETAVFKLTGEPFSFDSLSRALAGRPIRLNFEELSQTLGRKTGGSFPPPSQYTEKKTSRDWLQIVPVYTKEKMMTSGATVETGAQLGLFKSYWKAPGIDHFEVRRVHTGEVVFTGQLGEAEETVNRMTTGIEKTPGITEATQQATEKIKKIAKASLLPE